jgi:PhzF family phenazine biosynthesis protein
MSRPFHLIDVFGQEDFSGNPLAVVTGAGHLGAETMQQITQWLNLSETAFLLPPVDPRADYRVRIFTLDRELPFAGHPTLGSCHAWLSDAGQPKNAQEIIQECGAGLIRIRRNNQSLSFSAPPLIRFEPVSEAELAEVAEVLRIDPNVIVAAQWADNGPGWLAVLLESAQAVLAIEPVRTHRRRVDLGIVGPYPKGADPAYEIRALFSDHHGNIVEDPVTGSLNASVAQWLFSVGRVDRDYNTAQGTRLGRTGRVQLSRDETGQVWVGGRTRTMFSGELVTR